MHVYIVHPKLKPKLYLNHHHNFSKVSCYSRRLRLGTGAQGLGTKDYTLGTKD